MAERLAIDAQQIGPAQRPEVGELGPAEQGVHQLRPLVRRRVGEELPRLVGRRQRAGQVEVDAAQELGVVARARTGRRSAWRASSSTSLSMKLNCGSVFFTAAPGRGTMTRKRPTSPRYAAITAASPGTSRVVTRPSADDRRHRLVVRLEARVPGHVLFRAVGVRGDHLQLLTRPSGPCTRSAGSTRSATTCGASGAPSGIPAAIQARSAR